MKKKCLQLSSSLWSLLLFLPCLLFLKYTLFLPMSQAEKCLSSVLGHYWKQSCSVFLTSEIPSMEFVKKEKKRSETSVVVWQMTRQRNLTVYDCGCVINAPFHPPFHCSSVLTIVNAVFPMHLWLEGCAAVHLVHMAGFALKISCHTVAWIHLAVVYVYVHQPVCG